MDEVIRDTAGLLVPVLAGGAGGVATATAEALGADLYRRLVDLAAKIKNMVTRDDHEHVEQALRAGLAAGVVQPEELRQVVQQYQMRGGPVVGTMHAKNVFMGDTTIGTFNS